MAFGPDETRRQPGSRSSNIGDCPQFPTGFVLAAYGGESGSQSLSVAGILPLVAAALYYFFELSRKYGTYTISVRPEDYAEEAVHD